MDWARPAGLALLLMPGCLASDSSISGDREGVAGFENAKGMVAGDYQWATREVVGSAAFRVVFDGTNQSFPSDCRVLLGLAGRAVPGAEAGGLVLVEREGEVLLSAMARFGPLGAEVHSVSTDPVHAVVAQVADGGSDYAVLVNASLAELGGGVNQTISVIVAGSGALRPWPESILGRDSARVRLGCGPNNPVHFDWSDEPTLVTQADFDDTVRVGSLRASAVYDSSLSRTFNAPSVEIAMGPPQTALVQATRGEVVLDGNQYSRKWALPLADEVRLKGTPGDYAVRLTRFGTSSAGPGCNLECPDLFWVFMAGWLPHAPS